MVRINRRKIYQNTKENNIHGGNIIYIREKEKLEVDHGDVA